MMIDGFQTGDMVEMKWKQRSLSEETCDRTLHMILTAPLLTDIGTMQQRIEGWKCHVVYDSHHRGGKIPQDKYYDMKWLKSCERQGNLKIISASEAYER
jgi:hypothetical protein